MLKGALRSFPHACVLGFVLVAVPAVAQRSVPAAQRLAAATGAERIRLLAELTDSLKNDQPSKAIEYGQEALTLLSKNPDPAIEVQTLTELAWAYMVTGRNDEAVALATRGRTLAERHHDRKGLARALNNLGVVAQHKGDGEQAVDLFSQALAIYREIADEADAADALNNLGFVYSTELADYEKALAYHLEALKVCEALGDTASIALSLNNIGIVYARLDEHARALDSFNQALQLLRTQPNQRNRIAAIVNNIGDEYLAIGDLDKALGAHRQALDLRRAVGDRTGVAISLKNLGVVYTAQRQFDRARPVLEEGFKVAEQVSDRSTAALCLIGLASVHRQQGHAAQAVTEAHRAVDLARQIKAPELLRQGWQELSASQEQAGDIAGALASYKNFKATEDRIFDDEKAKRLERLERRYQGEKREAEIERLRNEQARAQLESNRRRFQLDAVVGGGVALGLVGFGLYRRRVESARIAAELSVTDALTGLKNRRYVQQTIAADLAACDRRLRSGGGAPLSSDIVFLLLDIDNFKSVNDNYGHAAGDAVLVQLAALVKETCRASDTIVRWGGEEFLIVNRFGDRRTAAAIAERMRAAMESFRFTIPDGRTIGRTCSIGFATYPFSPACPDALGWEQIVGLADHALYFAKRSGANAWVGLSASTAATAEGLRLHGVDDLVRAIAAGAIVAETSVDGGIAAAEAV